MNTTGATQLHMLADLQGYISKHLATLYDSSRSGDFLVCDELSRALVNSDKMTLIMRAIAKMAGTPQDFSSQEKDVLEMLERSRDFLVKRDAQARLDREIGYLEDDAS